MIARRILLIGAALLAAAGALAQRTPDAPRLVGNSPPTVPVPAPPVPRPITDDVRRYIEGSGAPMISVTHFMDRDGQVLADVGPRRYFCNACHVSQTDAQPLVRNTFRDALAR